LSFAFPASEFSQKHNFKFHVDTLFRWGEKHL